MWYNVLATERDVCEVLCLVVKFIFSVCGDEYVNKLIFKPHFAKRFLLNGHTLRLLKVIGDWHSNLESLWCLFPYILENAKSIKKNNKSRFENYNEK